MKLFPNASCPSCKGTISFFDVMSIITPFQSIYCATCGEMVFLKRPWGLLIISLVLAIFLSGLAIWVIRGNLASHFVVYFAPLLILVVAEFFLTAYVVKKGDLTVRRGR